MSRDKRHVLRRKDGAWVCNGGPRLPGQLGCPFRSEVYAEAVTHATVNGATPPDYPRDWVTA